MATKPPTSNLLCIKLYNKSSSGTGRLQPSRFLWKTSRLWRRAKRWNVQHSFKQLVGQKKKIPWNSYPDLYGIHWLTTMWGRQTKWYDPLVHQHSDKHLNVPKGRSRNWQSIQQHVKLPAGTIKGWTKWRWSLNIPGFSCTKAWKAKELEIFHGGQDRIYLSSPSVAVSGTLEVPVL